jgi:hypothetical protein
MTALGFMLCLSLVVSCHCEVASSPTEASSFSASDDIEIVGSYSDGILAYAAIKKSDGSIVYSESVSGNALGTVRPGNYIDRDRRYW